MSYTWEEVMFGIDTRNEQARKAEDQRRIEREAADEASAASAWSLGLSLLGGAIFGPIGYFIGKQIGTYGADLAHDWETETMEEGKFNVADAKRFNETLKEAASDQDKAQALGTVLDLGKMYMQAGGFTADPGELDFATFGSGEDAWTVFSDESKIPLLNWDVPGKQLPADQSLWSPKKGVIDNLAQVYKRGSALVGQDQAVSTLTQFGTDLYEAKQQKNKQNKEKPTGTSFPIQYKGQRRG